MHGSFFTQFIRSHFNIAFGRAGLKRNTRQLFVMDNDPSQTNKCAKEALEEIEAELLKLPPNCRYPLHRKFIPPNQMSLR